MRDLRTVAGGPGPRFGGHTGLAVPFLQCDVHCSDIAPSEIAALPGLSQAERAFQGLRWREDGSANPDFILNQEPYRDASILIAGKNFGVGSTPEVAVTRLMAMGIRVIIAPNFGSLFKNRCLNVGLLPVSLDSEPMESIVRWAQANPGGQMSIDLEELTIDCPGIEPLPFEFDPRMRKKLLVGLSDIDEIRPYMDYARSFRDDDRERRPWLYVDVLEDESE